MKRMSPSNDFDCAPAYIKLAVPITMRSYVWKHFGFPANEDGVILVKNKVVCSICDAYITYSQNTTNLKSHLSCKHPEVSTQFQSGSGQSVLKTIKSESSNSKPFRTQVEYLDEHFEMTPADGTNHIVGAGTSEYTHNDNLPDGLEQLKNLLMMDLISPDIVNGTGFQIFLKTSTSFRAPDDSQV